MGNIDRYIRDLDRWQTQNENLQAQQERDAQRQRERQERDLERIQRQADRDALESRKRSRSEQVQAKNEEARAVYQLFTQMHQHIPADFRKDFEPQLEELQAFDEIDFSQIEAPPQLPKPGAEPTLILPSEPAGIGKKFQAKAFTRATEDARAKYAFEVSEWKALSQKLKDEFEHRLATWNDRKEQFYVSQASEREAIKASNEKIAQSNESRREELRQWIQRLREGDAAVTEDYVRALIDEVRNIEVLNSSLSGLFSANKVIFDSTSRKLIVHIQVLNYEDEYFPRVRELVYYSSNDRIDKRLYTDYERFQMFGMLCTSTALAAGCVISKAEHSGSISVIEIRIIANVTNLATGTKTWTSFVFVSNSLAKFQEISLHQAVPYLALQAIGGSIDQRFSRPQNF